MNGSASFFLRIRGGGLTPLPGLCGGRGGSCRYWLVLHAFIALQVLHTIADPDPDDGPSEGLLLPKGANAGPSRDGLTKPCDMS